jgi:acetyltransferase-like isoleucine patch superfamily enzyme
MAYYSSEELINIGLKTFGNDVFISNKCSIYNGQNIEIGNNVRIDDYCVLSAGIEGIIIGSFIHIGVYTSIIGGGKVILEDFCNISSKVAIYSSNDDYSGNFMTNPMIDAKYTNVTMDTVIIGQHVIIGSGSIILPGVVLNKGCAIGALSLVKNDIPSFTIYAGNPIKFIKNRLNNIINIEKDFKQNS